MKVIVTGATGFIGRHLTRNLLRNDVEVIAICRSASNSSILPPETQIYIYNGIGCGALSALGDSKIDGIVHLASHYISQHVPEDIPALLSSNIQLGVELLELAKKTTSNGSSTRGLSGNIIRMKNTRL